MECRDGRAKAKAIKRFQDEDIQVITLSLENALSGLNLIEAHGERRTAIQNNEEISAY
jgi:hypothetical protein